MLKLHFAPNSRAGRIVWLLEELGLPYEMNRMAFHPKDLKSDEHRARHPLGRVPVLDDGDIRIYESGAIVDYVLERHENGGLKPAVDAPEFPMYLQWFHYCEGMVMPPVNTIIVHTLLLPPERRDETVLGQARRPAGPVPRPGGREPRGQGLPDRGFLRRGRHARPRLLHEQSPRLRGGRDDEPQGIRGTDHRAAGVPDGDQHAVRRGVPAVQAASARKQGSPASASQSTTRRRSASDRAWAILSRIICRDRSG